MTSFLGIQIDLVTLVQVLTTVVFFTAFAVHLSLQESDADHKSESEMLLLASFVTVHHPTLKSIESLVEATAKEVSQKNSEIHYFVPRLKVLSEKGSLPSTESAASTNFLEHIVVIICAPIVSVVAFLFHLSIERGYREHRIVHTALRENHVSKALIMIASDLVFLAVGAQLIHLDWRLSGFILCGVALVGLIAGFAYSLTLVREQMRWKEFWSERLLEIMAASVQGNNHDLFNRAHLLKTTVEFQSDVPIAGGLAFYAGGYSAIQIAVAWILGKAG